MSHFIDYAIHQRTNQCEEFAVLFNADKAQTNLYMFMREVGSCDESYQGEGEMGLLTYHIPAWTNIGNAGGSDDDV